MIYRILCVRLLVVDLNIELNNITNIKAENYFRKEHIKLLINKKRNKLPLYIEENSPPSNGSRKFI